MLIDTHCHLNYLHGGDLDAIEQTLLEAASVGVKQCISIGVDLAALPDVIAIGERFPQVKVSVGVHPCDVQSVPCDDALSQLSVLAAHQDVVAIGECGLDYYREDSLDKDLQKKYFSGQIELAMSCAKPLVVHTRQARADTIDVLRSVGRNDARGVLHCFTETKEMAAQALDLGFYISFSGIITFKNAESLRDVVRYVPMERLLVETDSPYLAPVPYRGKENCPAYVVEVAKQVALLKNLSYDAVCLQTTSNAQQLFGWPEVCG